MKNLILILFFLGFGSCSNIPLSQDEIDEIERHEKLMQIYDRQLDLFEQRERKKK